MTVVSPSREPIDAPAALCETHTGLVVLVGSHAFKVKKPVALPFLDLSTPESRWRVCRREVELNRRLAPDVYLDVAALSGTDGCAPEPVIVMRRMPEERRLSTLVTSGADVTQDLRAVARLLASFHQRAGRGDLVAREGRASRLWHRWRLNLAESARISPAVLDPAQCSEIARLASRYVRGRVGLFLGRAEDGLVVDGHGDLLAEDIFCLPDHPRVLDCLEFDDALRYVDVLDDAAFLAMDLESLGRPDLAASFLTYYQQFSGTPSVTSLVHHYTAYRAFVRAKVSAIRAAQGSAPAAARARDHACMALQHLRAGEVRLVLVAGTPGTGKTTLAGALADRLGCTLLSSDRVRQEVAPRGPRYTDLAKDVVYAELLARVRESLEHGESVVADATWAAERWRRAAVRVAEQTCSTVTALQCTVPTEVAAARAERRAGCHSDPSEADARVARLLAQQWNPWPIAAQVDTGGPIASVVTQALRRIDPCG